MSDHDTLETMPEQSLEDEIATLSATLSAATHRLITLVGDPPRRALGQRRGHGAGEHHWSVFVMPNSA